MKHLRVICASVGIAASDFSSKNLSIGSSTCLLNSTKMCVMNLHVRGTQNQSKCDFKVSFYVYKTANGKFICRIHNYILAGRL